MPTVIPSHGAPPDNGQPREIRAITGLRGVAAVLVAAYHFTNWGLAAPRLMAPAIRHGYLGVDLFFVLSGFVMALTYGGLRHDGRFPYRIFLARRLRRLYPLYVAAILAAFLLARAGLLGAPSPWAASLPRLGVDLLMLQCLGAGEALLRVSWSLSTEWAAYLLFPVLAHVALWRSPRAAWILGVGCLLAVWGLCAVPNSWLPGFPLRALLHHPLDLPDTSTVFPLVRCLVEFCLGLLAWRTVGSRAGMLAATPAMPALLLAACAAVLWVPWADHAIVPLFALLLVGLGAAHTRRMDRRQMASVRWLGGSVAHWLGTVSYALYLTHMLLWQMVHGRTDWSGMPLLLLLPALLSAAIVHYGIEKPARRLIRSGRLGGMCHSPQTPRRDRALP